MMHDILKQAKWQGSLYPYSCIHLFLDISMNVMTFVVALKIKLFSSAEHQLY